MLASVAANRKHAELRKKFPDMEHDDPNALRLSPFASGAILWKLTKRAARSNMASKARRVTPLMILQRSKHRKGPRADMRSGGRQNHHAVPRRSHSEQALRDVQDLSRPIQDELEKFFIATDELEDKKLKIIGWKGPKVA